MNDDNFATPPDSAAADVERRPAPGTKKRSGGSRWVNVLVGVAVLVFVGGVTFAIGRPRAPVRASFQATSREAASTLASSWAVGSVTAPSRARSRALTDRP
jgi:hypothetical protein